jgi:hypothetical protein
MVSKPNVVTAGPKNSGLHLNCTHIFSTTKHAPSTLLSCTRKCTKLYQLLHPLCIRSKLKMLQWLPSESFLISSILAISEFAKFPLRLNLLQIHTLRTFYLHSKLDCLKKLISVTRITGAVKGVVGYVILNYVECHNRVVITNAHATSILTCDRIAS